MRVGVLILPEKRWSESVNQWRTAEELGFDSAWTYDHLSWRSLRDGPWYSAFPVLTAAACATSRMTIGTLVTSANFRHPVMVAKDAITIDDISGGRFILGLGAGSADAGDSEVLSQETFSPQTRAARFTEFVDLTDRLLREPVTTHEGRFFSAFEARMLPGCVQRPRLPMAIAATGPKGLALTARHGDAWVTCGPASWAAGFTPDECLDAVRQQVGDLLKACDLVGRDHRRLDRIFVVTDMAGAFLESPASFLKMADLYAEAGITHLVLHWPRQEGIYAHAPDILHRIADESLAKVQELIL